MKSKVQRAVIVQAARTWKGTPYHHQGRVKGVGVDCIGLILGVLEECGMVGLDCPEYRRYPRVPPRGKSMLHYFDKGCGKRLPVPEPGDIVIFWMSEQSKKAQHCALKTDRGILHTYSDIGKVVENTFDDYWQDRVICAYHAPGVE